MTTNLATRGKVGAVGLFLLTAAIAHAEKSTVERGEYLVHAGGCISCHTEDADDAVPLAGGRALESPYGTFYSPNITPDLDTGIGNWTDEDFLDAMWHGVNPEGDHYYPAFPFTSYTGILRDDVLAIKAYLFSLPPVRKQNRKHDLSMMMSRFTAGIWHSRYFEAGRFEPEPDKSGVWNRGAYLVRHLGHCGECHTPRGKFGVLKRDKALTGNPDGPGGESVPGITADPEDGIGDWSISDIEYFLDLGMYPDGDFAGSSMAEVIEQGTSHLTKEDRVAIATYLKSLTPDEDQ